MEYESLISSGTVDDLPPSYHTRISKAGRGGERRRHTTVELAPHSRLSLSRHMEAKIHSLEQGAYASVLCAFQAQSDAISWEKESLMAELRKELRVSDDEHRELLSNVKADDTIHQIREWRQTGGNQVMLSTPRKKQRISESARHFSGYGSVKPMSFPPSRDGSRLIYNPSAEADPRSGRKVQMRFPEDNRVCEAVSSDYNPLEMPHEDTQWDEDPSSISSERNRGAVGRNKGCNASAPDSLKPTALTNNQINIELFNTRSLVKEVSRVFVACNPDPAEIFKAKKMLKEHELALVEAIARLGDASDSETDGEEAYAEEGPLMEL